MSDHAEHPQVTPSTGQINWGDLNRNTPFCDNFGFSRGGAIDRVYTDRFRDRCRALVRGTCLEVGPLPNQRDPLADGADQYFSIDRRQRPDTSFTGELSDPDLLADTSFDTVIALHVLEHTASPQEAVDRIHAILRPGGCALVCCPTVQRLHGLPHDYWRPMPAGLAYLFRDFDRVESHTFGNLQTSIAALAGIAPQELPEVAFQIDDPNFPVLTAVVAQKSIATAADNGCRNQS